MQPWSAALAICLLANASALASEPVRLSAVYTAGESQPIGAGLVWRVFSAQAGPDGKFPLVAETSEPTPVVPLDDGDYIVHAACGLAGVARRITVAGAPLTQKLVMNAGGLKLTGVLGDAPIPPTRLAIQVYLPEANDPEAKLILPNLKAGEPVCLPEGNYHVVSRLMDVGGAASTATNSVIYADLKVLAGKLTAGELRHRAATMTLKLVNTPGGEALANTAFSVLTPGGDVIREMIGAFPSMVLAEGEYIAIARHDNRTYQATFKVESGQDRDVEVLARSAAPDVTGPPAAPEAPAAPKPPEAPPALAPGSSPTGTAPTGTAPTDPAGAAGAD
jgi:hypothetical protein